MRIRCTYNTGEALRAYESRPLSKDEIGRFGATEHTQFGLIVGKEYMVMGMIMSSGILNYLIDDSGYISAYPYPLFEVISNKLPSSWFFGALKSTDNNYSYQEAIWGYYELVFDKTHYEKLVDLDEEATRMYFRHKIELEKELYEGQ